MSKILLAGIVTPLLAVTLFAAPSGALSWQKMSPDQRYDHVMNWKKQHCPGLNDPGRVAGRNYVSQARTFDEFYANIKQYCGK